jgi:hypothetical protein
LVFRAGGGAAGEIERAVISPDELGFFFAVDLETKSRLSGMRVVAPPGLGLDGAGITADLGAGYIIEVLARSAPAGNTHSFGIVVVRMVFDFFPNALKGFAKLGRIRWTDQSSETRDL